MKRISILLLFFVLSFSPSNAKDSKERKMNFFPANNPNIQYTGRIDFRNPLLPRFWQPGVYIETRFIGSDCEIILNDQVLWGKNHNYLEIVVDGKPVRLQTTSQRDTFVVAKGLSSGTHTLLICKNTEGNIGYLELVGIRCKQLLMPAPKPARKIEFIGNSITCGASSDQSVIPCGKGVWHDQHNAYLSYGPVVSRALKAQWILSSVSGIGLMHSCCGMNIVMPPVFDKIDLRGDSLAWNFANYQPNVVAICLGQNDGIQDSVAFCNAYVEFLDQLRGHYPNAQFILASSPMGNEQLTSMFKKYLHVIQLAMNDKGDKKVAVYFYSKQYNNGCDYHPDLADHQLMGEELGSFIKKIMKW